MGAEGAGRLFAQLVPCLALCGRWQIRLGEAGGTAQSHSRASREEAELSRLGPWQVTVPAASASPERGVPGSGSLWSVFLCTPASQQVSSNEINNVELDQRYSIYNKSPYL